MTAKKATSKHDDDGVVSVMVNGQVVGTVPNSALLGQAANDIAKTHGLRTYSLKVNGKKLTATSDVGKSLKEWHAKSIELYAKDSRG